MVLIALAAAAGPDTEAPVNEFGYLGPDPIPWWEIALPYAIVGLWLVFCGFATWLVAVRLKQILGASGLSFAISAFVPVLLFLVFYIGLSVTFGERSVSETVLGITRFTAEGYALLIATGVVGVIVARFSATGQHRNTEPVAEVFE